MAGGVNASLSLAAYLLSEISDRRNTSCSYCSSSCAVKGVRPTTSGTALIECIRRLEKAILGIPRPCPLSSGWSSVISSIETMLGDWAATTSSGTVLSAGSCVSRPGSQESSLLDLSSVWPASDTLASTSSSVEARLFLRQVSTNRSRFSGSGKTGSRGGGFGDDGRLGSVVFSSTGDSLFWALVAGGVAALSPSPSPSVPASVSPPGSRVFRSSSAGS